MKSVNVKIFTTPTCPRCPEAKAIIKEISMEFDIVVDEIDLSQDPITGLQYQVASAPSVVVNDYVVARGSVPEKDELIMQIERAME
ncbi:MAG: thioredoxin family protein [Candidatus Hydrothermarchaeales archaeon]